MAYSGKKKKSVLGIIEGIVIAILILFIAAILMLYLAFSDKSAAPKVGGYVFYHTRAVNMEPEIPVNSAVIGMVSEIENIKAGSVIICRIGDNSVLTRVVQLNNNNGQMSYVTKWDTAASSDTFEVSSENVIAKAIWTNRDLGLLLDFSTSTFGIMMIIIIPSFVIIVFQIIKIINVKRMEEEALSLEDLDEIMNSEDEPESEPEETVSAPAPKKTSPPEQSGGMLDNLKPVNFEKPEQEKTVLNIDKNGKAELKPVTEESTPLFKFENEDVPRRKNPFGEEEKTAETEEKPQESAPVSFMSNVLPEKLAAAVSDAEKPAAKPEAPKAEQPAAPDAQAQSPAKPAAAIPEKAVVPKERIAPPAKKNTKKTINELMSMIDAEESKLK